MFHFKMVSGKKDLTVILLDKLIFPHYTYY